MATQTVEKSETDTFYEVGYLVSPTLPEDKVEDLESELHEAISENGGEVHTSKVPEMRELAYKIEVDDETGGHEFERGQFGWVQFSCSSEDVDAIEENFTDEDDVIRHLLIAIDAEDIGDPESEESSEESEEGDGGEEEVTTEEE